MDIYKLISEITDSNDLVNCGKKLLVFADQVFPKNTGFLMLMNYMGVLLTRSMFTM